jgi:hypothetical protein
MIPIRFWKGIRFGRRNLFGSAMSSGRRYIRPARITASMNELGFSTKSIGVPRIETKQILKAQHEENKDIELDIIERHRFGGSDHEVNEFIGHIERNTYIICPRGTENYSYRIYEALSRGRNPVVIDRDVVLPKELDWDHLSIRLPYDSLQKIYDVVRFDYTSRSESSSLRDKATLSHQWRSFALCAGHAR